MPVLCMVLALTIAGRADGAPGGSSSLKGVISDDRGRPIAGANVFIRAAGPREGVGVL